MVKLLLSRARRQVKISRLIYTNSGDSILALASNTIHLPWIWPRNDHNSSSKGVVNVNMFREVLKLCKEAQLVDR
ncbi:topless-related protein [Trifolium repens]|nr:topless-related protein [Trifolium repens]